MKRCVIVVGHGGVPTDCPRELIAEFKRLEALHGALSDSPELAEADRKLRQWPRSPQTDPYQAGLEAIVATLRQQFPNRLVLEAYNEFCAPSLQDSLKRAVAEGSRQITLISTMFTRGGIHSETEIPEIVAAFKRRNPSIDLNYAWPFSLEAVAEFLADEISRAERGTLAR